MKNLLIIVLNLLVWTTSFGQTGNPGLGGALFDPPTIEVGQTTELTFSISETGLGVIPADGIIIQISLADLYYKTDGVTPPGGTGGALFNWTHDGSSGDVWFGTNPNEIGIIEGGLITLDVTGMAVSPDFENTTVNIFINDPNLAGTDNTGDNSVTPKLKVTPATTFDCLNLPNGPNVDGAICDDGDPNTTGDVWDANCDCAGTTTDPCIAFGGDADRDGICANEDCNDNDASVGLPQTVYIDGDGDGLGFNPRPFELVQAPFNLPVNSTLGFGANYNRSERNVSIEISATAGDFNSPDDFLNLKLNGIFVKKIFAGAVDCSGDCSETVTISEADWNAMLPMLGSMINIDLESIGNCDSNTSTLCNPEVSIKIFYTETSETSGCLGVNIAPTAGDCDDSNANIKVAGDACDDGDISTIGDVIQADCSCEGTPTGISIDCPRDLVESVIFGPSGYVIIFDQPTSNSDCPNGNVSVTQTAGSALGTRIFGALDETATFTATDDCGNTAICSFDIKITTQPSTTTIENCPDDITVTAASPTDVLTVASWAEPTVTTDCPDGINEFVLISGTGQSGDAFPEGTSRVRYIASDNCGGGDACSFNVIVLDFCHASGGNNDGDGFCADNDCNDNNPNINEPGDSCDDGDVNTNNDLIQADCSCSGTPIGTPDCEGVLNGSAVAGSACDDGDALTENDVWDADCNCVGTLIPLDCEGTPNGSAVAGSACDDGDALTENDVWDADCNCAGTLIPLDCEGTPNGSAVAGSACDDGDALTENDVWDADCNCAGTLIPLDCEGTPNGSAVAGSACDDGNALTENDVWDADCNCAGTLIPLDCEGTPNGSAVAGSACDDGDALTENDVWDADCNCAGTLIPLDCEGTPNGSAVAGSACDDGDALTENDVWDVDCNCAGTLIPLDCEGTPNGSAVAGSACDDGDALTENDVWDADCNCAGTLIPLDCEGTPNGSAVAGSACDDGDALTENDVWDVDCNCAGTLIPLDCEGTPNGSAVAGSACDDGDALTENDVWDADCNCAGTLIPLDCEGTPNGSAVAGSACDDGDALTENDVWDADCNCAGTLIPLDCEGMPNGSAVAGSACDDGDALTENDVWDADCNCAGTLIPLDCEGTPNGSAVAGSACDDGDALTENDVWDADCNCAGTPIVPTDCSVSYEVIDNDIVISGIPTTTAYYYTVKILDNNFIPVDQCGTFLGMNCAPTFEVNDLPSGTYWIQIEVQDASDFTTYICQILESVNIDSDPPPTCRIDAAASGIRCNDNGTTDPNDDTFTYNLTISGGTAWGYNLNGIDNYQPNFVSETISMGPFAISDGIRTDVIKDYDNPSCETQVTVTPPDPCSDTPPVCEIIASASNMQCDDKGTPTPNDDTYTYDLIISGGTGNGYTLNGTDVSDPGFVSAVVSMGPFAISAGVRTDNVSDYQNASCSDVVVVSPPAPCSTPDPGDCQATYVVNSDGTITVSGLDGVVNIVKVHDVGDNFSTIWSCDPWYAGTPTCGSTTTTDPLLPGVYYLKILTFSDAGVTQQVCDISEYLTIAPPTGDCSISATVADIVCSDQGTSSPDDDTYSFVVNVNRSNGSNDGWEILNTSVNHEMSHSATVDGLLIADGNRIFTIRDEADTDCKTTIRVIPPAPCSTTGDCTNNVTSGGSIRVTESKICSGEQPGPIMNQQLPSGGTGEMEYMWLASTTGCPDIITQAIPNTNMSSYQPGALTQTTYFRRCSRRKGCTDWTKGETSCVKIEVETCNPPTGDCDISIVLSGNDLTISGLPDENQFYNSVKVFKKGTQYLAYQCHNWSSPTCGSSVTFDDLPIGTYTVEVLSQVDFNSDPKCSETMDFTVGSTARMISFDAAYQSGIVQLMWTDMITTVGDDYEIEKSTDGVIFEPLMNVISEKDSDAPKFFQRKDLNPLAGDNFYRLKLHTVEGEELHSEIRKIRISDIENFGLFPNPATEEVHISFRRFEERPTRIQLTNQLGQVMKIVETDGSGFSRQTISLTGMPSGIYTVWVFPEGMKPVGKKLIIAKK